MSSDEIALNADFPNTRLLFPSSYARCPSLPTLHCAALLKIRFHISGSVFGVKCGHTPAPVMLCLQTFPIEEKRRQAADRIDRTALHQTQDGLF